MSVDFLFVKNSSSNCENDVDSFILKLGNISNARTKTRTMYKDLDREKVLDEDLQAVARTPPQFSMVEDNILVYRKISYMPCEPNTQLRNFPV